MADAPSAESARQAWEHLIGSKKFKEARTICTEWTKSGDNLVAAEGFKCLANIELEGTSALIIRGDEGGGGGSLANGYHGPGVAMAIADLSRAAELSPADLSIHLGRLHIILYSDDPRGLAEALEDTIRRYPADDGLEDWLNYCSEIFELGRYNVGAEFTRVLVRQWPNDHRTVGNLGAFLLALKKDDEALLYLRKAVELAPNDSIDNWNLGRVFDFTGNQDDAELLYRKALALEKHAETIEENSCLFAHFLDEKRHKQDEACKLEKEHCPKGKREACGK